VTAPRPALAWSDEGHEIVALIAEHYLDEAARTKVAMLLVLDTDTLTDHDLASEATWAGKYRETATRPRSAIKEHGDVTSWTSNSPNRGLTQPISAIHRFLPASWPRKGHHKRA
jgi:hypothetical protein